MIATPKYFQQQDYILRGYIVLRYSFKQHVILRLDVISKMKIINVKGCDISTLNKRSHFTSVS